MAQIKVKYQDKKQVFEVENKPVSLKYLMYLFEHKMNIPYYEELDFKIDGKTIYSGKKQDLDSFISFLLSESKEYEMQFI